MMQISQSGVTRKNRLATSPVTNIKTVASSPACKGAECGMQVAEAIEPIVFGVVFGSWLAVPFGQIFFLLEKL
jgi:hypothetical protein